MANKVNIVITATDKASGKIGKLGGGLKDLGKKAALGIGLVGVAAVGAGSRGYRHGGKLRRRA